MCFFLSPTRLFLKLQWQALYRHHIKRAVRRFMSFTEEMKAAGLTRGMWIYDKCSVHDRADVRLEAKDEDDLDTSSGVSNATQHWQTHDQDKAFNMQFKAKFYSNLFNKMIGYGMVELGELVADDVLVAEVIIETWMEIKDS